MPDSIHDLATHICSLAVQEGPLDDDCHESARMIEGAAYLLHLQESPEADEEIEDAVQKLVEVFSSPNIERAGYVARLCGALLEEQIISPSFEGPLYRILDEAIPGALAFDAKLKQGLMEEEDYDAVFEGLNQAHPREANDWAKLEHFHLPVLSVLANSPEARSRAAERWLSNLVMFESSAAAHWLVRMLKTLHQERFLIIEPGIGRGFEGLMSGISSNFELHDMLAMLIWENRASKTPGIRRFSEMLRPEPQAGKGFWNLYNWTSVREGQLPNVSDQSSSHHWIWGEGCPADITAFEGRRVVLLGPPSYPRSWNVGQELPQLRPQILIQRWLNRHEVKDWMNRFGQAAGSGI